MLKQVKIQSLPVVKCFCCGKDITFVAWCIHSSGVYCVDCAPIGSKVFQ